MIKENPEKNTIKAFRHKMHMDKMYVCSHYQEFYQSFK